MINAKEIRPEIFEEAAEIVENDEREYACCTALYDIGAKVEERKLFVEMFQPLLVGKESLWFGTTYEKSNQELRAQLLREVALNLRAQGFCK